MNLEIELLKIKIEFKMFLLTVEYYIIQAEMYILKKWMKSEQEVKSIDSETYALKIQSVDEAVTNKI
ncbi:hypothetical protein ACFO5O_03355 [Geojedonia litorea]|uniref:Uncharacterized protein n=1 Tax=Geojedonia litorea TaxID=1268269 RepID=A0ABV9MZF5_9FLAO